MNPTIRGTRCRADNRDTERVLERILLHCVRANGCEHIYPQFHSVYHAIDPSQCIHIVNT